MSAADEGYEDLDFEALEQAVRQSPKGNWFLDEYARRLRSTESTNILGAIAKLERIITSQGSPAAEAPQDQPLPPRQLRYFKKDEDLFEQARSAPSVAAVESTGPAESKSQHPVEQRGARLKIMRMEQPAVIAGNDMPAAPPSPAESSGQENSEAKAAATTTAAEAAVERNKHRIIISRHAASDMPAIPLVEDAAASAAR